MKNQGCFAAIVVLSTVLHGAGIGSLWWYGGQNPLHIFEKKVTVRSKPQFEPVQAVAVDESEVRSALQELNRIQQQDERSALKAQKILKKQVNDLKKARAQQDRELAVQNKIHEDMTRALKSLEQAQSEVAAQKAVVLEQKATEEKALELIERERRKAELLAAAAREEMTRLQKKNSAEKERQARLAKIRSQYIVQIQLAVTQHWRPPVEERGSSETTRVWVEQLRNGVVLDVRLECSLSRAYCDSVVQAVRAASPLPQAPVSEVFESEIEFIFQPQLGSE